MARATPRVAHAALIDPANAAQSIVVGTPHWYAWLQGATTFAFRDAAGRFTARKERRGPADGYWRAYRNYAGVVRSAYLGRTADLTLERLQAVAVTLGQPDTAGGAPTLSEMDPPIASVAPPAHLLRTKFSAPPTRSLLVARPRLTERLQAGLMGKLTLIAAPAGFGKTTIVSAWRATPGALPLAWVALDPRDNDPIRFWSYVVAALDTLRPGLGAAPLMLLQAAQPPPIESILTTLLNLVSGWDTDLALLLDDYHVIDSPAIHHALVFLLDHLPPHLHLVIASRADPPLPLSRLRARGELTELRAADLRFMPDEAATFLREVMGVPLPADAVAALEARTEGWITGLQFAALALCDRADHERFIAAFTGSNRFVMDYLVEEVLDRLPLHLQSFLLATSILDRLCSSLCDALPLDLLLPLHSLGSQAMLEDLERTNLFLVPLDDERRWYRYHHLFAEVLRARLTRVMTAEAVVALHRCASSWHEQHGLSVEAVQHALLAQDWERAAQLIEQHAWSVVYCGQIHTVLGWFKALPATLIRVRPALGILSAYMLLHTDQLDAAEAQLKEAELGISPDTPADLARAIRGRIFTTHANISFYRGDLSGCVALGRQALDLLPETMSIPRVTAMAFAAQAFLVTGDVTSATESQVAAVAPAARAAGNRFVLLRSFTLLAQLQLLQGRLQAAAATYREVTQLAQEPGEIQTMIGSAAYYFGLGDLCREWNDLAAAEQFLADGMNLAIGQMTANAIYVAHGCIALARLQHARGDHASAFATLTRLSDLGCQRSFDPLVLARGAAMRAQLGLAHDLSAAKGWADASGLHVDDPDLPFPREAEYLTLARLHIALQRATAARQGLSGVVRLLDRLLARAEAQGRIGSAIEILVVRSLALGAEQESTEAISSLERALRLAESERYVRIFVDEGGPLAALLAQVAGSESPVAEYARRLLAAFPGAAPNAPPPIRAHTAASRAPHVLAEPPTEREIEVLRLIEAGCSNQAIAAALVVAISTVKKHINNLYGKLGVQSRTQALMRARELDLL